MIVFQKLRYKNFLSTGNVFTEIDFNRNQNTLVVGTNGAGKSTFIDALSFNLFGRPFRNVNKPQLVNTINNKDCLTELEFTNGNHQYLIRRGLKVNVFEIYVDDVMINQDAASRDYQDYLEKNILKFNYKSFKQIIALSSSSFTPFMQLRARDRREIIEDLLDLNIFSTMNNLLKSRNSEMKLDLKDKNNQLSILSSKISNYELLIERATKNQENRITEINKKIELIKSEGLEKRNEIKKLQSQIEELDSLKNELSEERSKVGQTNSDIKNLKTRITEFTEKDKFLSDHDQCPVCLQNINEDHIDSVHKHNEKMVKELNKKIKKITDASIDTSRNISYLSDRIEAMNKKSSQINTLLGELRTSASYIKTLTNELTTIESENNDADEETLLDLKSQYNTADDNVKNIKSELSVQNLAFDILKDTGIKSKIINQYVPMINKLVNKYLASMDFFVQFELDENFNETIRSRHRDAFSYSSFSEGEKMRIDLALLLTWRSVARLKNSVKTNLLILDEVFDSSLDDQGVDDVLKLLKSLDGNIFLISHKGDILQDKFENTIKFIKPNNFSIIDESIS